MHYGHKKRGSKPGIALLSPGMLLECKCSFKQNSALQNLGEIRLRASLTDCYINPYKNAMLTLICELLQKTLREEESHPELFDYLDRSILTLNALEQHYANFHLVFMLQFSRFLGFYPYKQEVTAPCFFDLQAGTFSSTRPMHPHYADTQLSLLLAQLIDLDFHTMHRCPLSKHQRNKLTHLLISYFQHHLSYLGEMKSLDVLQDIF